MNAVAARLPSDDNDHVPFPGFFAHLIFRHDADIAAKNERVADKFFVKQYGTVDRRYSHFVAIIAHAADDPLHDPLRMQGPRRQFLETRVRRGKTKDIGAADRLGPESRA